MKLSLKFETYVTHLRHQIKFFTTCQYLHTHTHNFKTEWSKLQQRNNTYEGILKDETECLWDEVISQSQCHDHGYNQRVRETYNPIPPWRTVWSAYMLAHLGRRFVLYRRSVPHVTGWFLFWEGQSELQISALRTGFEYYGPQQQRKKRVTSE